MSRRLALLLLSGCSLSVAASQPAAAPAALRAMVTLPELPLPTSPHPFDAAKRLLERQVYDSTHRRELYCGCSYDDSKTIDFDACESAHPYVPIERHGSRAARVEWEHVVPASWIGRVMPCWSEPAPRASHRDHCRETSPAFANAEGDMHDLFPSIGQLNALRDDDAYGEIDGESHVGGCDFEIDAASHRVEPRDEVRGDVARATFYVSATYRVPLRRELYETLVRWHRADPPDDFERLRNDRIERLQGNRNPYVDVRGARP